MTGDQLNFELTAWIRLCSQLLPPSVPNQSTTLAATNLWLYINPCLDIKDPLRSQQIITGIDPMDELALLRGRIEVLEAESAIRRLQAAYMEACDFHIGYPIGELFAPDGIWEGVGRFASGFGATKGRQAVAEQFEADKNRLPFAAHYLTNEQIWVNGDTARAKWMFLEPAVHAGLGAILIAGRYDNDFVSIDGRWYIRHLRCGDIFVASYRDGWAGFPCLETGWIEESGGSARK
jgi:hypothetical protein